jgi:hypothetical protein
MNFLPLGRGPSIVILSLRCFSIDILVEFNWRGPRVLHVVEVGWLHDLTG